MRPVPAKRLRSPPKLALVSPHETADNVEQRRLAGAVRADDTDDLALGDGSRHVRESGETTEPHRDVLDL
jgi:hypothetical protein